MTEVLIYTMVVFGPWAFGTTQPWSIWLMNGAGYALGVILPASWPFAGSKVTTRLAGTMAGALRSGLG